MCGSPMIEFILARYNYWIVIILMMAGLYIVFSRGNLIKTIVGLNLFQTSVFIFYITVSKVAGGTAPILISTKADKSYGDDKAPHGADQGGDHGGDHSTDQVADAPADHAAPLSAQDAAAFINGDAANGLEANVPGAAMDPNPADMPSGSLHDMAGVADGNSLLTPTDGGERPAPDLAPAQVDPAEGAASGTDYGAEYAADYPQAASDILYSNPLPHVLILTAIVVGVATTAVGLAIAVRIREAYGTVEEDALEQADNEAEFGPVPGAAL